jgi:anti-sigma regulatory factor (Ser/Thr protein kinase)
VAVIVSELVTNSVVHANVGHDQSLCVQLTPLGDRLRIAVTDPGSESEPRLLPQDPAAPGGFGLRVVDQVSAAWGIVREISGATRVWCDVPLGGGAAL